MFYLDIHIRLTNTLEDEKIKKWKGEQANITKSLRYLILKVIESNGFDDVFKKELDKLKEE